MRRINVPIDKLRMVSIRIPEWQYRWLKSQKDITLSEQVRVLINKEMKVNENKD